MQLEIFYDFLCEFCELGHRYWSRVLPRYPEIVPVWRPCEAHPRDEEPWGKHSDLAIQALFYLQEQGGDVAAYNERLFDAIYRQWADVESPQLLAALAAEAGADEKGCLAALREGRFALAQREANRYAYGQCRVQAVPTFILENGQRLDATLGVGVTERQLERLLRGALER